MYYYMNNKYNSINIAKCSNGIIDVSPMTICYHPPTLPISQIHFYTVINLSYIKIHFSPYIFDACVQSVSFL